MENQIHKLQDDGASNFQDESSLAPSNLLKRGIISQAPSHRPHNKRHEQMSALDEVDQDHLIDDEEGLKKRRVKEKQKREADKEIDRRNKEEEEKRKKKKSAEVVNKMQSGRINAMLTGKTKSKGANAFNKESDEIAGKDAEDLITKMTEAT